MAQLVEPQETVKAVRTEDAILAAAAVAVAGPALGGLWLRGWHGPRRDAFLRLVDRYAGALLVRTHRIAPHTDPEQLLAGIELSETLRAGRIVQRAGLIENLQGGLLVLAMAERAPIALLAPMIQAIDAQRVCLLAIDESLPDALRLPALLQDRLGMGVDLRDEMVLWPVDSDLYQTAFAQALALRLTDAAHHWKEVIASPEAVKALVEAAAQLGILSSRASLYAVRLAKLSAALAGRSMVEADDLAVAVRLVLLPQARQLPAAAAHEEDGMQSAEEGTSEPDDPQDAPRNEEEPTRPKPPLPPETEQDSEASPPEPAEASSALPDGAAERLVAAALATLPKHLLAQLAASSSTARSKAAGATGAGAQAMKGRGRGRSIGALPRRRPRSGERLHLLASIRAAAPFQALRRRVSGEDTFSPNSLVRLDADDQTRRLLHSGTSGKVLEMRPDDLHVHREKKRRGNTTVFVVDASGSMALQRLSEAKGAIEILLADCYVRRDRVAMIAFRGKGAEVLLDPTRSLVAAKRSLTALPGGGGSPVAAGLALAAQMVAQLKRMGDSTVVVVLTDGRANLTRDGLPGRQQAALEAQRMARFLAVSADKRLLIDTSMRPEPAAQALAAAMRGMYMPMPFAQAREMGQAVIAAQLKA
ncbi:MAG: VWA domain-containing protein [Betaproteobacteria bacterium]|nr:VWA domain-containing protein [Betaproteobacteria bacterium]